MKSKQLIFLITISLSILCFTVNSFAGRAKEPKWTSSSKLSFEECRDVEKEERKQYLKETEEFIGWLSLKESEIQDQNITSSFFDNMDKKKYAYRFAYFFKEQKTNNWESVYLGLLLDSALLGNKYASIDVGVEYQKGISIGRFGKIKSDRRATDFFKLADKQGSCMAKFLYKRRSKRGNTDYHWVKNDLERGISGTNGAYETFKGSMKKLMVSKKVQEQERVAEDKKNAEETASDFDEFETMVESKKMICSYDINNNVVDYNYRYDGKNLFLEGEKLSGVKQKPGKEIFIWVQEIQLIQSKVKHFIDFENYKAVINPLTGVTAGQKVIGACLPQ